MSFVARLLNGFLRTIEKPALAGATDPVKIRRRFELNARLLFHAPRGPQMQWQTLEQGPRRVETLQILPKGTRTKQVILYIHGGGFLFGSPKTHAAMVAVLVKRLGARAVMPRYRLAPEHPFPAAFDDVRTAWDGLIASGVDPKDIVIGGDSAGGALALSVLGSLVAEKAALPGAVFCFSPLTDLTFSGQSIQSNAEIEALLPAAKAEELAQMYLAGHATVDPKVSPLQATFAGAPPVWIAVSDTEILLDDARRMAAQLEQGGVDVTYVQEQALPHVWPIFHNVLPEGRQTLDALAKWIKAQQHLPDES